MPQKKKDRDVDSVRNGVRIDHLQTDHDLFLHAFEKPTQIYRYLRTRNIICPVFLHRNLTYLKGRCNRQNRERNNFKVDSLLAAKINKSRTENFTWLGDYMTLMFLGFFDKSISNLDVVEVETYLTKISQKKRKDSLKVLQERLGTSVVKINPDDTTCPTKVPAISVSTENFKPIGGSLTRSYILQLNVTVLPSFSSAGQIIEDEPGTKRMKNCTNITYESELVVFDKHSRCLLSDGEYELSLQERYPCKKIYSAKKPPTWECIPDASIDALDKAVSPFEDFHKCPTLKFRLVWTKEKIADLVDRPLPITIKKEDTILANKENQPDQNHNNGTLSLSHTLSPSQMGLQQNSITDITALALKDATTPLQQQPQSQLQQPQQLQVVYQFIYNNNSLQQTEACDNFNCPWCTLNCMCLYSLLKHLKLCHDRFNFTYVPMANSARIDVTINELYDGSYTGSPHDLVGPSSFAFSRTGPKRRPIVTSILVCRPKRQKPNLSEFLEIDENELNSQRPYITGHNRLYYHTMTCLPVHPKELDIDSEDENDTAWLQKKTTMMIDEFTDVNEGEKELMKMWNLHTIKNGYVGDIQIPLACDMFVDLKGIEILQKNLYKNFVMHVCNLCDYGLVSPDVQYKIIRKMQRLWSTCETSQKILINASENQLKYWCDIGQQKQQQKLHQQHLEQQQKISMPDDVKDTKSIGNKKEKEPKTRADTKDEKSIKIENASLIIAGAKKILSKLHPQNCGEQVTGRRKTIALLGQSKEKQKSAVTITGITTTSLAGAASTTSGSIVAGQSHSAQENGIIKRKFIQLRGSPPRRRSSGTGTTDNIKLITNRRNSMAANITGSSTASRKRLSLTLTKVDR